MVHDTRNRFDRENPPNRAHSPEGSGLLVPLFEGVWHQSPLPEDAATDGSTLVLNDFYTVATDLDKAIGAGGHAFGTVFHALWHRAPTPWAEPEWSAYPGWAYAHKREILLGTQAVHDLLAEHLQAPKQRILTPAAARITHIVIHDFDLLGDEVEPRNYRAEDE